MDCNFWTKLWENKFSKKLWGSVLLVAGDQYFIVFSIILFISSMVGSTADASTALGIINMLLISGGGLLGLDAFRNGVGRR